MNQNFVSTIERPALKRLAALCFGDKPLASFSAGDTIVTDHALPVDLLLKAVVYMVQFDLRGYRVAAQPVSSIAPYLDYRTQTVVCGSKQTALEVAFDLPEAQAYISLPAWINRDVVAIIDDTVNFAAEIDKLAEAKSVLLASGGQWYLLAIEKTDLFAGGITRTFKIWRQLALTVVLGSEYTSPADYAALTWGTTVLWSTPYQPKHAAQEGALDAGEIERNTMAEMEGEK